MPLFNFKNKISTGEMQSVGISNGDLLSFGNPNLFDDHKDYVSAETALRNSDIFSLIFQLSSDLASSRLIADQARNQGIIDNPSKTSNKHAFWQSMYAQLLLSGEAFAYRWRNNNGTDLRWEYLRPSQVSPFLLDDGSGLVYNLTFDEPEIGLMEYVPSSDLIHIRLMSKNGGMTGISPLSALSSEVSIKNKSNSLTLNALSQSSTATGALKERGDVKLSGKDKMARSKAFMKQMQNGVVVLDSLEDFVPLEIKSNVAQLLNQVNWTSEQIAKVYGVPSSVLNGKGDQQSSLQMENTVYTKSLARYANSVVDELDNKLSANIKIDMRPAVDPLGDTYATTISSLVKDGVIAPNQASYELKRAGYLSNDIPDAQFPLKGGDNNGNSNNQG